MNVIVLQPKKKPRKQKLTTAEKFINRCISSARTIVENVIAGVKRSRIVKDVFRNWKSDFDDLVMFLACGLHNLRVAHRSPIEPFNLVDFLFPIMSIISIVIGVQPLMASTSIRIDHAFQTQRAVEIMSCHCEQSTFLFHFGSFRKMP